MVCVERYNNPVDSATQVIQSPTPLSYITHGLDLLKQKKIKKNRACVQPPLTRPASNVLYFQEYTTKVLSGKTDLL